MLATDCDGLTLRGFTIDFDPLAFTQGTVETIDPEKREITFTLHDGYPDLAPHYLSGRAHLFSPDPVSPKWKTTAPDIYATKATALTPRRGVLYFSPAEKAKFAAFALGDYVALDFRHSRGIRVERASNLRIENVTLHSVPSIGVICRYMDGKNVFRYKIERGPLPPGATIPRLLSTSADGLNYAYARTGPLVEQCDFSFMGDDSINLHGITFFVARVDGRTVSLLRPYPQEAFASIIAPGDEIRSLAPDTFDVKGRSKVVRFAIDPHPAEDFSELAARTWKSAAVKAGKLTVYRLEFSDPLPLETGDFLELPAISAPGWIIRDNHFHDHRGRALRLMASNGIAENNLIENIKQAAITIGPEFAFWREAGWVDNVTIRNNTIRRVGYDQRPATYAPGAISVFYRGETPDAPRPAMRNENIRIEQNTIEQTGGPAIHINQARNIRVTKNRIRDTFQTPSPKSGSLFQLTTDRDISVNHSDKVIIE
ncbi:right-handed parallel beta-helix repeat-containing protein [Opitutaceae bacterium TAV3]|nr:right-handed parallel beta-helix repeat-containing protein [Opitutaceae bacterium TAV3]